MSRIPSLTLIHLVWLSLATTSAAVSYYIDADGGSDGNAGTSPAEAWASLDKASTHTFQAGDQVLLQCGDVFAGKLKLDNDSGTEPAPVVVASYGTGDRPIIDAAGYLAGVHIANSDHVEVRDLEITADGGAVVDGSDETLRYGVHVNNWGSATINGITLRNLYIHDIYPPVDSPHEGRNPTTYLGTGINLQSSAAVPSSNALVEDCRIERVGYKAIQLRYMSFVDILNNDMKDIGGPAMQPSRCQDLLVRGNVVDGSGAYTDPRMHGRGSGIWPWTCERVLIEKNVFMHARGRYDSCGAHIDFNCRDVVVQYNLSVDNEGGFVEILGNNHNCAYRYNISINDGARVKGVAGAGGDGYTIQVNGYVGSGNTPDGPYNSYIYNNTIYVRSDIRSSFRIDESTDGLLIANNIFFIEGPTENGTPSHMDDYTQAMIDRVVWKNNLYQRGGVVPDDFPFTDIFPILGNPNLANPGGPADEDYVPAATDLGPAQGIAIEKIPGDSIGLDIGLAVSEDYFGNPIVGLPDVGAVEVGGALSPVPGAAFLILPAPVSADSIGMTAASGPANTRYYFTEITGNYGGDDSGWQSSPAYIDEGLLPNTRYAYSVTLRDELDQAGGASVITHVTSPPNQPFPDHLILDEDFSSRPDPENTASPLPVSTWYCSSAQTWSSEGQDSSVQGQGSGTLRAGWGYDEVLVQYYSDQTWDLTRDYQFSGDWEIDNVLDLHLGLIVGVGAYDPTTGALLQRIKEVTVGELGTPVIGQLGSFVLPLSDAELQAAGVDPASRVGVFLHHDDDGILHQQSSGLKNDVYEVDNLVLRFFGDDVDSDSDGIPDGHEIASGMDPEDPADGACDADGDGSTNAQEYLAGTGMHDSSDRFSAHTSPPTVSVPEITIPESKILAGRLYILEHKCSLTAAEFWKAVNAMSGTLETGNGDYSFLYPSSASWDFFRIRVEWE
jgi:hypothetical protein